MVVLVDCVAVVAAAQVEKIIAEDKRIAKEFATAGKKRQALTALRHKKLQEKQLQNIDAWLNNVEELVRES